MDEDRGVVVGGDGDFVESAFAGFGEGLNAAARFAADGDDGGKIRANFRDAFAGDEHGEVHPVRADVRDGPEIAAEIGFETPIPVRGEKEPVLVKFSVDEPGTPDRAGRDEGACFLTKRIVAKIVRYAADLSGFLFDGAEHCGFA